MARPTWTPRRTPPAVLLVLVIVSFALTACDEVVHLGGAVGPPISRGGAVQQFSSTTVEEHIHFDADHTAATRHVTFDVANDDPNVRAIVLSAFASFDEPLQRPPGIAVTLMPDQPPGTIVAEYGRGPAANMGLAGGWGLVLTDPCRASCSHGATIVARLDGEPPAGEIPAGGLDVTLEGRLWASGGSGSAKLDIQLALRNDTDQAFTRDPTSRVATDKGKLLVTSAAPMAKKRLQVRVAADALKAPVKYPLVVTVTAFARARVIEFADMPSTIVTIGDVEVSLPGEGLSVQSVDVGPSCQAGHVCEIPVTVRVDYTPTVTVMNPPSAPRAGSGDVSWRIEVRVEAFDGRKLPADAVSIE